MRCSVCGETYSDDYDGCPKCAAAKKGNRYWIIMFVVMLVLALIGGGGPISWLFGLCAAVAAIAGIGSVFLRAYRSGRNGN